MNEQDFSRYQQLVSSLALPALKKITPCAHGNGLDVAVAAARLLLEDAPSLHAGLADGFERLAAQADDAPPMLADTGGDRRDVYHPLALHLHLAAFNKHYETLPPNIWSRCDEAMQRAVTPARQVEHHASSPPDCDNMARVLWHTLSLYELATAQQRDTDVEWLDSVVHHIIQTPNQVGALHLIDESESIELWTYRELCALHALANLALLRRNDGWAKRVAQVAAHHEAVTQPDYATTQPWGVFAFIWTSPTSMFADQQLHDAQHAGGGSLQLIAALLLADTVHALNAFA